jgi:putative spermidine/putrescine transport system substrate-binding protein
MRAEGLLAGVLVVVVTACQVLPAAPAGPASRAEGAGELVISSFGGTWGQAIQLGLVDSFERETGIKVTVRGDQNDGRSAELVRGGSLPPEDLIDTNQATALALQRDGLLAPIDYGAFDRPTLDRLPEYARLPHALGWGQFAIGLCYDRDVFPDPANAPRTWADFWNVSRFPGMRGMLAWSEEPQPEFGLLADGVAAESLYPLDLDRAYRKLSELRPYIPRFPANPGELGQLLVDREVVMEACFTHRVQRLVDGGVTRIAIAFDEARLQTSYAVVWKNAPNRENAMRFLAHMVRAQPQATWAQIGNTGPINPDAFQFIAEDVATRLPTSPTYPNTWVKNDEWYSTTGADGLTQREILVDRWRTWLAECGPSPGGRDLPAWRGALVGARNCGPGQ